LEFFVSRHPARDYSRLAGPLRKFSASDKPYEVRSQRLPTKGGWGDNLITLFLGVGGPAAMGLAIFWLFQADNWPSTPTGRIVVGMGLCIMVFTTLQVLSVGQALVWAVCPVPVEPEVGYRLCFYTCFVPASEDIGRLEKTLAGMTNQTYGTRWPGIVDAWVLDEGDSDEVKALCKKYGVNHWSRKNLPAVEFIIPPWTRASFARRTKHGNVNHFVYWLRCDGREYDFFAYVDCDHVPKPVFIERMLGYFRDPYVGCVVAPQTYENAHPSNQSHTIVARLAESAQFVFHTLMQLAGNRTGSALMVGTNGIARAAALMEIGGLQPLITEDALTGLALSNRRGNRWKIISTPDELAVGLGPVTFRDMFSQQLRWAQGTNMIIMHHASQFRQLALRHPRRFLHYCLLMLYYPTAALCFVLGVACCVLYAVTGTAGLEVSTWRWMGIYTDILAMLVCLFVWARRHNVSSMEPEYSSGFGGLFMASMCAPVYVWALIKAIFRHTRMPKPKLPKAKRKQPGSQPGKSEVFKVTPKGDKVIPDTPGSFKYSLPWVGLLSTALVYQIWAGHTNPFMIFWTSLAIVICSGPLVIWMFDAPRQRRMAQTNQETVEQLELAPVTANSPGGEI
jgi:cellulose synthase/poly-beta-1,6-N-acetylglucosamine synthase-like glycosyltransferase